MVQIEYFWILLQITEMESSPDEINPEHASV